MSLFFKGFTEQTLLENDNSRYHYYLGITWWALEKYEFSKEEFEIAYSMEPLDTYKKILERQRKKCRVFFARPFLI